MEEATRRDQVMKLREKERALQMARDRRMLAEQRADAAKAQAQKMAAALATLDEKRADKKQEAEKTIDKRKKRVATLEAGREKSRQQALHDGVRNSVVHERQVRHAPREPLRPTPALV